MLFPLPGRLTTEGYTVFQRAEEMRECVLIVAIAAFIISSGSQVQAYGSDHRYIDGDPVPLYVSRTAPYHNPSETYGYYDLPFCRPDYVNEKKQSLHDVLNGDQFFSAPYRLEFLVNKDFEVACAKNLTKEEVSKFRDAVAKDYYIQMHGDDLPMWSFIGSTVMDNRYYLFSHIIFDIYYNNKHVIAITVRVDTDNLVELPKEREVDMKWRYTVHWEKTVDRFENRMEKYSSPQQYTWTIRLFSIVNSCVTILLLTGCFLTYYVRVLKKDLESFYNEALGDEQEERGWKLIHGDVFRYPHHKSLFASAIGSGAQLFTLMILILVLGIAGAFSSYRQRYLFIALVAIYAITSGVAGYVSSSFYAQLEGANWVRNLLLTGFLFNGPLFATFCFINTVAIAYKTTAALPLGTIILIFLIWILVALPLLVLGGIVGKNCKAEFQAPCRTTKCPRTIPPLRFYKGPVPQTALAGFLPLSVVYNELYFIFTSLWGHRIYTVYGFLLLVFILLLITSILVTVALTYWQLAAEDHRWWWRSFVCGGSVGLYMYAYCIYYYYYQSFFSGFLQLVFFFGYMACICYGVFLMVGMIGFFASLLFIRHIYGSIKCD